MWDYFATFMITHPKKEKNWLILLWSHHLSIAPQLKVFSYSTKSISVPPTPYLRLRNHSKRRSSKIVRARSWWGPEQNRIFWKYHYCCTQESTESASYLDKICMKPSQNGEGRGLESTTPNKNKKAKQNKTLYIHIGMEKNVKERKHW